MILKNAEVQVIRPGPPTTDYTTGNVTRTETVIRCFNCTVVAKSLTTFKKFGESRGTDADYAGDIPNVGIEVWVPVQRGLASIETTDDLQTSGFRYRIISVESYSVGYRVMAYVPRNQTQYLHHIDCADGIVTGTFELVVS